MALIKCKECGKVISTTAENCPHCGWRTQHGRSITNAKFQLFMLVIAVAAIIIGLILLFVNMNDFFELLDDWDDTYYDCGLIEYAEIRDETGVLWSMFLAVPLIVGGLIDLFRLVKKIEKDQETLENGFLLEQKEEKIKTEFAERQRQQRQRAYAQKCLQKQQANTTADRTVEQQEQKADFPAGNGRVKAICCPVCGKSQFANTRQCFFCGTELTVPKKKEEKAEIYEQQPCAHTSCEPDSKKTVQPEEQYIFCHNCGKKMRASARHCNACGTRLMCE